MPKERCVTRSIRISESLIKKLKKLAKKDDRSVNYLVIKAIELYIKNNNGGKRWSKMDRGAMYAWGNFAKMNWPQEND